MIKSQYQEMLEIINNDKYAMISFDTVCDDVGTQTVNSNAIDSRFQYDEKEIVLNSLVSLLGLIVVKMTFSYHGDDYKKVRYFFITKEEKPLLEKLTKILDERR